MSEEQKVNIKVDQDRLGDLVTVDQFIEMQEGRVRTIRDVLAEFVVDDSGKFIGKDEGVKVIGRLTFNQLMQAASDFVGLAEGTSVPKGNGRA